MKNEKIRLYYIRVNFYTLIKFYTPSNKPLERFYELASTCFGLRKSIYNAEIETSYDLCFPFENDEIIERLEYNGDIYIWRNDGARKMLEPYPDNDWDVSYCKK